MFVCASRCVHTDACRWLCAYRWVCAYRWACAYRWVYALHAHRNMRFHATYRVLCIFDLVARFLRLTIQLLHKCFNQCLHSANHVPVCVHARIHVCMAQIGPASCTHVWLHTCVLCVSYVYQCVCMCLMYMHAHTSRQVSGC